MSPRPAKRTRLATTANERTDQAEKRERSRIASTIRPDTVFRLRHVPQKYGKEDIPDILRAALQQSSDFPVQVGSLARSPYRTDEQVATVALPKAGSLLPNIATVSDNGFEWQMDVDLRGQKRFTLRLDVHFQGLTPLHACDEIECTTDIIAISGLNGHAFGSFKQRGGPFMWLRDALPENLPNTRVFIYGYDTQLYGSSSVQNLTDLGISLRTALMDLLSQNEEDRSRSLLFIGHSLGGLLIKEAFIHMKDSAFEKILNVTRGFMFFGVPNLGMAIGSLIPMVGNQPNRGLLESLRRNSALLRRNSEEFPRVFRPNLQPPPIVSFYETKQSRTACKVGDGWRMQGPEELLVDFASATVGCMDYYPIDRSHSDMVKFSGIEDPSYRATFMGIKKLNEGRIPSNSDKLACLRSLAFSSQEWHRDGVVSADGTCDWIFAHETFHDWSQNPNKLLWIRGKPGSGKSTIMKHIFQSLNDRKTNDRILAAFFFNGGDKFLTTLLALYRALLNQLMSHSMKHISALALSYAQKIKQKGACDWSADELRRFFAQVVPAVARRHRVSILIDALDEAGEDTATQLIAQFEKVLAAVDNAGGVLNICFSCRHYPIITLDAGLIITMERENQEDIEMVVRERIRHFQKEEGHALIEEILSKAEGVFQWACLVADRASSLRRRCKNFQFILGEIRRTPKELKQLYRSILFDTVPDEDPGERRQTLKLFQWMCFSYRPLTQKETQHVLAIHADMTFRSVREYIRGENFISDEDDVTEVVKDISKGLAEFRQHGRKPAMLPIHQTVRDYLLENGLRELHGSTIHDPWKIGHYYIFKTCVKYLKLEEVMETDPDNLALSISQSEETGPLYSQPLLYYSLLSIPYHLHQSGKTEILSGELLEIFEWPHERSMVRKWGTLWRILDHVRPTEVRDILAKSIHGTDPGPANMDMNVVGWPRPGLQLLHLAAVLGKTEILDLMSARASEFDVQSEELSGRIAFRMALEARQERFVVKLLSIFPSLIESELVVSPCFSAFKAAEYGLDSVLSIAFHHGLDPNAYSKEWGRSLLHLATEWDRKSTCRLLLDKGADPMTARNPRATR